MPRSVPFPQVLIRPVRPAVPTQPDALPCSRSCAHCRGTGLVREASLPRYPGAERYAVTRACGVCDGKGKTAIDRHEAERLVAWRQALRGVTGQDVRPRRG